MDAIAQRILEIVLEQRSVSDDIIALQVSELCEASELPAHTRKLAADGLLAESEFAEGRWHVTDAGREALG